MKVRPIDIGGVHFERATELVRDEWNEYLPHFIWECNAVKAPYFTLLGAFDKDQLCGITVLAKSMMSWDIWELSWVVVDPKHRGRGIGKLLVIQAEQVAVAARDNYPPCRVVMQLTTHIPAFYEALGYKVIEPIRPKTSILMLKYVH